MRPFLVSARLTQGPFDEFQGALRGAAILEDGLGGIFPQLGACGLIVQKRLKLAVQRVR